MPKPGSARVRIRLHLADRADLAAVLDDPTHSTERAKITGPRRKVPKKSSLKVAVWAGAVALVVIALLLIVNFTMSGSPAKKPGVAPLDAAPVAADAGVGLPAPADAAEQFTMVKLRIETVPPGAMIIKDGVPQGEVTPATVEVVDKEKDVKFILQREGYNDQEFVMNPKEKLPAGNKFRFTLKRPAPGAPPIRHAPPPGSGSGSAGGAAAGSGSAGRALDRTGGELGGNPLRSGGGAPKK